MFLMALQRRGQVAHMLQAAPALGNTSSANTYLKAVPAFKLPWGVCSPKLGQRSCRPEACVGCDSMSYSNIWCLLVWFVVPSEAHAACLDEQQHSWIGVAVALPQSHT